MSEVKHLKLINGEEIIGRTCDETGLYPGNIVLDTVRSLTIHEVAPGKAGIGMVPFMMGNPDGRIKIPTSDIMGEAITEVPKKLEDSYLQQVSGITFATEGKIIV